jgi:Trk K+ transport system NAD-binding subunit
MPENQRLIWMTLPLSGIFERRVAHREIEDLGGGDEKRGASLFGLGRVGAALANDPQPLSCCLPAVDCDPVVVRLHSYEDYPTRYGYAEDMEFIATLPQAQTDRVVGTTGDRAFKRALLQSLLQQSYEGKVAVSAATQHDAAVFERQGVDLALIPSADAAKEAAERLLQAEDTAVKRANAGEFT